MIAYLKTPHTEELSPVTPHPGLALAVVVVTLTVPRVAVQPLGLALLCTLSVIVSVAKV